MAQVDMIPKHESAFKFDVSRGACVYACCPLSIAHCIVFLCHELCAIKFAAVSAPLGTTEGCAVGDYVSVAFTGTVRERGVRTRSWRLRTAHPGDPTA
jgi:hypothetical protein